LFNHARLFRMLPHWIQKVSSQSRLWLWIKVLAGILIPSFVILGLPPLVHSIQGGPADWIEPFKLMPDLIVWLLLGMSLNLIRNLFHAWVLLHQPGQNNLSWARIIERN